MQVTENLAAHQKSQIYSLTREWGNLVRLFFNIIFTSTIVMHKESDSGISVFPHYFYVHFSGYLFNCIENS